MPTATEEDARYVIQIVTAICHDVGPGLPGTPQEHQRAERIRAGLESHLARDAVSVERFTLAPDAFLSLYPGIFMLLAVLLNLAAGNGWWLPPVPAAAVALALSVATAVLFVVEFLLARELVDGLLRQRESVNVIGRLHGPGAPPTRRVLLVSGHHDSALESTWLALTGYGFYVLSTAFFVTMVTMLVMSGIQLAGAIAGDPGVLRAGTLGWLLLFPIVPGLLFGLFSTRGRKGGGKVPGAVDNLAASALTVALARWLAEHPSCIPDGVEVRFVSFGSEEAGLRGSRRYVARHLDELRRLDARLLNLEMIAHPEITILSSDLNGILAGSPAMVDSLVAAAKRAGVPHRVKAASLGVSTDAASFLRAGLPAATLLPFELPRQQIAYYHQASDRPEVLTVEPLLNVLRLAIEWIRAGGAVDDASTTPRAADPDLTPRAPSP